jgi:Ca2+-binding RTX toxin-like protein
MSTVPWGVAALSSNSPIAGSPGDDNLAGTGDADFFFLNDGGNDHASGGDGDDSFYFGTALASGDTVDGGSGNDMLILQASGFYNADLTGVGLNSIEMLLLMSASDTRFGASGTGAANYILYIDDAAVAAGQTLTIQGNKLGANEHLNFVGFNETDGNFRLIGGAGSDYLLGGGGADMIFGGLGIDHMDGWTGNDVFVYRSAADSSAAAPDLIDNLSAGDLIDLRMIDADTGSSGDQAFAFIGSDAFHHVAGELRVFGDGGNWTLQADTDGDGAADFAIMGQYGAMPPDASFFLL